MHISELGGFCNGICLVKYLAVIWHILFMVRKVFWWDEVASNSQIALALVQKENCYFRGQYSMMLKWVCSIQNRKNMLGKKHSFTIYNANNNHSTTWGDRDKSQDTGAKKGSSGVRKQEILS